jgi:hypothetical protein
VKHIFEPKLADKGFEFQSQTKCLSVNFECECLTMGSYIEKRLHPHQSEAWSSQLSMKEQLTQTRAEQCWLQLTCSLHSHQQTDGTFVQRYHSASRLKMDRSWEWSMDRWVQTSAATCVEMSLHQQTQDRQALRVVNGQAGPDLSSYLCRDITPRSTEAMN